MQITDSARRLQVPSQRQLVLAAGNQSDHAGCLVRTCFRVLVHKEQDGVVQQRAIAFSYRLQFGDQIGELFYMPAADVTQDALAFGAFLPGSLAVFVGVVVMARGGVAQATGIAPAPGTW